MTASTYSEDHCEHLAFECRGGWHECTDCGRGLGDRNHILEAHAADQCSLCGPVYATSSCVHDDTTICLTCTRQIKARLGEVSQHQDEMDVPYGMPPKFVTKDSGARQQFESGMQRDTQEGKARFDLLFPLDVPYGDQFMTRCAELLARGAEKYDTRNWEQAAGEEELERFRASALRHLMQWVAGDTDEDHAAAVVFNLLGYETTKWKMENSG